MAKRHASFSESESLEDLLGTRVERSSAWILVGPFLLILFSVPLLQIGGFGPGSGRPDAEPGKAASQQEAGAAPAGSRPTPRRRCWSRFPDPRRDPLGRDSPFLGIPPGERERAARVRPGEDPVVPDGRPGSWQQQGLRRRERLALLPARPRFRDGARDLRSRRAPAPAKEDGRPEPRGGTEPGPGTGPPPAPLRPGGSEASSSSSSRYPTRSRWSRGTSAGDSKGRRRIPSLEPRLRRVPRGPAAGRGRGLRVRSGDRRRAGPPLPPCGHPLDAGADGTGRSRPRDPAPQEGPAPGRRRPLPVAGQRRGPVERRRPPRNAPAARGPEGLRAPGRGRAPGHHRGGREPPGRRRSDPRSSSWATASRTSTRTSSLGWGSSAGFAEHLSLALGLPIDVVAINGGGADGARVEIAGPGGPRTARAGQGRRLRVRRPGPDDGELEGPPSSLRLRPRKPPSRKAARPLPCRRASRSSSGCACWRSLLFRPPTAPRTRTASPP